MKPGSYTKPLQASAILLTVLVFASSCTDFMFNSPVRGNGFLAMEEREAKEFSAVYYGIPGKLILKNGTTTSLVIEADDNIIPFVETRIVNNTLHIKTRENLLPGKNGLTVYLTAPEITRISLNGSGNVFGEDVFQARQISLNINGSGNITMKTDVEKLNSKINGSGNIKLSGYGEVHEIEIRGSGSVLAYDVQTIECLVKVMGSGSSYVSVANRLDAHIMGSGNVYVKGSPNIYARTQGSGRVITAGS
jgi:hypothetical protein